MSVAKLRKGIRDIPLYVAVNISNTSILPLQPPVKLKNFKVQDGVGSSEIALRTGSACESTGYGQEKISRGNNVSLLGSIFRDIT